MKLIETKRKAPALIAALLFGALIFASCSNSTSEETDRRRRVESGFRKKERNGRNLS